MPQAYPRYPQYPQSRLWMIPPISFWVELCYDGNRKVVRVKDHEFRVEKQNGIPGDCGIQCIYRHIYDGGQWGICEGIPLPAAP